MLTPTAYSLNGFGNVLHINAFNYVKISYYSYNVNPKTTFVLVIIKYLW